MNCCQWDGALDGRIIRCKKHLAAYRAEKAQKKRDQRVIKELSQELTSRGLGWVVARVTQKENK